MRGDKSNLLYIPAHVRRFSDQKMKTEKILISKWFPRPLRNGLFFGLTNKNGFIRQSDYIIGPLYKDGDLQVGVTGGVGIREPSKKAISREMGEEIGLVPINMDDLQKSGRGKYGNKFMQTYNIYIKDCFPVVDSLHGVSVSEKKDSRNNKVGAIVYGSKNQIISFLSSEQIYIYKSNDKIQGVGAFKVSDIIPLLKNGKYFIP